MIEDLDFIRDDITEYTTQDKRASTVDLELTRIFHSYIMVYGQIWTEIHIHK